MLILYSALKNYVLIGGWKNARFVTEPRGIKADNILYQYATACEMIA
jgi:hypothetical protein